MTGRITRDAVLWAARAFMIWLCATLALTSAAIHSGTALRYFITPHYSGALIFGAAFLLAILLGLAVESPKWAVILTFAMCLVGAAVYGGVIYSPIWLDIAATTIAFQNYVCQQVLLLFLWCSIPAMTGALLGNFAGASLRPPRGAREATPQTTWWDRARSPEA
jgi:hypothetical protein